MMTQQTLQSLLDNLEKMVKLSEDKKIKVYLIKPGMSEQKDTVLFLLEPEIKMDTFQKLRFKDQLQKLMEGEIDILSPNQISPQMRADMLSEKIPLSLASRQQIKEFFELKLIPFSQNPEIDIYTPSSLSSSSSSILTDQDLMRILQQNRERLPELLAAACPDTVVQAYSLMEQRQPQNLINTYS